MQCHNADGQGGDQAQNSNLVSDIKVIGWLVEDYLGRRLPRPRAICTMHTLTPAPLKGSARTAHGAYSNQRG